MWMAIEIERKFLLKNRNWRKLAEKGTVYKQGYLTAPGGSSSIRVRSSDHCAWLNIKSATMGMTRTEFEYEIPFDDAEQILTNLCLKPVIHKTRYELRMGQHVWEIDEFHDDNDGLVVAEIELNSEQEEFDKPEWLGEEVTDDKRYYNVSLVNNPYKNW
jgi:adenylate cyclase